MHPSMCVRAQHPYMDASSLIWACMHETPSFRHACIHVCTHHLCMHACILYHPDIHASSVIWTCMHLDSYGHACMHETPSFRHACIHPDVYTSPIHACIRLSSRHACHHPSMHASMCVTIIWGMHACMTHHHLGTHA
jgi:hypothetical protein